MTFLRVRFMLTTYTQPRRLIEDRSPLHYLPHPWSLQSQLGVSVSQTWRHNKRLRVAHCVEQRQDATNHDILLDTESV